MPNNNKRIKWIESRVGIYLAIILILLIIMCVLNQKLIIPCIIGYFLILAYSIWNAQKKEDEIYRICRPKRK